tara:strand:- start:3337 stop:3486 length:150 start_codon:yes stop_codon:yes gene_type:complete
MLLSGIWESFLKSISGYWDSLMARSLQANSALSKEYLMQVLYSLAGQMP